MIVIFAIILLSMVMSLIRAISGPTVYDRILAANTFGTKTVIFIILLALQMNEPMLLDVALVYVLINFITTIGFLKYFRHKSLGRG